MSSNAAVKHDFHGEKVFLSLGSNLGDSRNCITSAIESIGKMEGTRVDLVSDFYRAEPIDTASDKWFLNCVAAITTTLAPLELLDGLEDIELLLGRNCKQLNTPRTIDIDILLYGEMIVSMPRLSIPHPRMAKRRFVLEPLAQIAPHAMHPVARSTAAQLSAQVEGQKVVREEFKNDGI